MKWDSRQTGSSERSKGTLAALVPSLTHCSIFHAALQTYETPTTELFMEFYVGMTDSQENNTYPPKSWVDD